MLPLAFAASLNAAAPTAVIPTDQLPGLFIAACLDGSARMQPGSTMPVEFAALPSDLRELLGKPRKAQVWKINSTDATYLYSINYKNWRSASRICGVASDGLQLRAGSAAVEARLRGTPSAGSFDTIEWIKGEEGYSALATRKGRYTILQIKWNNQEAAQTE